MDSSISPEDEIWFLRVYHHISNAVYVESFGDFFCMEGSEIHQFGEYFSLLQWEIVQCFGDPFRFNPQEMIIRQWLRRIFLTPSWGNDQTSNVSDIQSDSIISKWSGDRLLKTVLSIKERSMSNFSGVVYNAITKGRQRGRLKVLKKWFLAMNWSDWLPDEFLPILVAVTIYVVFLITITQQMRQTGSTHRWKIYEKGKVVFVHSI